MSQIATKSHNIVSDMDEATRKQWHAAQPDTSVWVGASAGSGKTKVLTDRLLRLLLPQPDGRAGTPPHRILCLTYTKAAASEMALRLNKCLGEWASADDDALENMLKTLLGHLPDDHEKESARNLFAAVVDTPGGLKIMTIHSFCRSVLSRFPLEAGIPPHFNPLEDTEARALLVKARDKVITYARKNRDSKEGSALESMAIQQNAEDFTTLINGFIGERRQVYALIEEYGSIAGLHGAICDALKIDPAWTESDVITAFCREGYDEPGLRLACKVLIDAGTDTRDRTRALILQDWLDGDVSARVAMFDTYSGVYLTKAGTISKQFPTKGPKEAEERLEEIIQREAERVLQVQDRLKAIRCAVLTRDLFLLGQAILDEYARLKSYRAALDFDDLILKTLKLLEGGMMGWVMYKLDGGLDHILIDEAQDTNPEQWRIVQALCSDFFSGQGAREDIERTVFSVGDEKQSIYSFQRAAPEKFEEMRGYFKNRVQQGGGQWNDVSMEISFRSAPAVLSFVDEVFKPDHLRKGLSLATLSHKPFHDKRAGRIEVWPLFKSPQKKEHDVWAAMLKPTNSQSGSSRLAEHIADTIDRICKAGEWLDTKQRAAEAGDFLILVRRRNAFVNQLIRALKQREIPVNGVDRMVLKDQLAVQDLMAVAQFALLPEDDLTLACVLKSPLIGWTDATLEELAAYRPEKQTLWQALQESDDKEVVAYLDVLLDYAAADHPYEFFSRVLQQKCPADDRSGLHAMTYRLGKEALDPLDEFLNAAMHYERESVPTLQGFLLSVSQGENEIKREQEESGGRVRIMTVHGAKGLEAPIVILPDTTRTGTSTAIKGADKLLWPEKIESLSVPLWSPRKDDNCDVYSEKTDEYAVKQDEEYRRLLYVALTRAEERLYIGGYEGGNRSVPESWYNYACDAIQRMKNFHTGVFESKFFQENSGEDEAESAYYYIESKPQGDVKPIKAQDVVEFSGAFEGTSWLFKDAPEEPRPSRPLMPSRPSDPYPAVQSPLEESDTYRFTRGNVTHRLLQFLPDIVPEDRKEKAMAYVERQGRDLPESVRQSIVTETFMILEKPEYTALFGPDSQPEVPVTGQVGAQMVSGQIDRLVVTDKEIWIVDFKTNRPPPQESTDIPLLYRRQMKAYSDIVSNIYEGRTVRAFLLWTDGPDLMEVPL